MGIGGNYKEQLINDDIETETEYLGQNDTNDDFMIDQLLENDSSEYIQHDLGIHHDYESQGPSVLPLELETFKAFSNLKSNVYFWQEYICNQEDEIC